MGGEWEKETLIKLLSIAKEKQLKTALYTGEDDVSQDIKDHLTFIKVGRWSEDLGGLASPTTNQKFINLETQEILNKEFIGVLHA